MSSLFIYGFFSSQLAHAVCHTLLHSVWQGLLAAAISGIIITGTRKTKAAIRYNLLSLVFICFIVCSAITFLDQLTTSSDSLKEEVFQQSSPGNRFVINPNKEYWLPPIHKDKFYQQVIFYTDKYATWVTWAWLLIFFMQIARMSIVLYFAVRLRIVQLIDPFA